MRLWAIGLPRIRLVGCGQWAARIRVGLRTVAPLRSGQKRQRETRTPRTSLAEPCDLTQCAFDHPMFSSLRLQSKILAIPVRLRTRNDATKSAGSKRGAPARWPLRAGEASTGTLSMPARNGEQGLVAGTRGDAGNRRAPRVGTAAALITRAALGHARAHHARMLVRRHASTHEPLLVRGRPRGSPRAGCACGRTGHSRNWTRRAATARPKIRRAA